MWDFRTLSQVSNKIKNSRYFPLDVIRAPWTEELDVIRAPWTEEHGL